MSENISRRIVLSRVACAAVAAPVIATMVTTRDAWAAKMSKSAAKYQDTPKGEQRCDNCALWQAPDGCKSVSGTLKPEGWCKIWVAKPT
jgi:hypothetical protein